MADIIAHDLTKGSVASDDYLIGIDTSNDSEVYQTLVSDLVRLILNESTGAITYSSGFSAYSGQTPVLKKAGKVVDFHGAITYSGSGSIVADTNYTTICTIPTGYRPATMINVLCQGNGTETYLLRINTNGTVQFARYRNAAGTYQTITSSKNVWLPFSVSWIVA